MALDLKKIRSEQAATGADLTNPTSGGGDYAPPAEGPTRLRLTGYVETGIHKSVYQGAEKIKPRAEITFELSGPKHEPRKLDDGTMIPMRVTIKETVGTHSKNGYIKLFDILNTDGTAKNYVDLIGEGKWRGKVTHYKFKGSDGKDVTIAQLKVKGAYNIEPVTFEDPESGETRTVAVPPPVGPIRVFLWDYADLDQWDSLLDFQKDKIRTAENFVGSPIFTLLTEAGRESELALSKKDKEAEEPDADDPSTGADPAPETPAPTKAPTKAPASPKAPAKPAAKATPAKTKPTPPAASGDPLQGL